MKTTEEKTIKQWLNTLKEPYKTKAIQQTNKLNKEVLKETRESLISSLYSMFVWEDSIEGDEYWRDLVLSLENIEK